MGGRLTLGDTVMANEKETQSEQEEQLKKIATDLAALEREWAELPEETKRANPDLAKWFKQ
jgi:hypothetical protein